MAARRDQDATPRATKKFDPVVETALLGPFPSLAELTAESKQKPFATEFEQSASLLPHLTSTEEARGAALWDKAVESLGRSAVVMEELAGSTGEVIARIAARGDRIDRIQNETRALLNALVASEADA